ncbi:hypothetical protein [Rodentibacter genomosp. 2]|uniref:hypothetical protein n=1 Tax=Rodentibacter genomosp. 2 TaxID=1908266 RepID=UPI0013018867|nr:hypothetical protein [Rodentibacter genomosp. 2]
MEIYFMGVVITFILVFWATGAKWGTAFFSALIWPLALLSPLIGLFFSFKKDN